MDSELLTNDPNDLQVAIFERTISYSPCELSVITLFNQTPIYEWYTATLVVKLEQRP